MEVCFMQKKCVLYDRLCRNCGECDYCDLNPFKICDSCGKCIETQQDYREVKIDGIITGDRRKPYKH